MFQIWFVTDQQIKMWHDNNDYCNEDELVEWFEGYQYVRPKKPE